MQMIVICFAVVDLFIVTFIRFGLNELLLRFSLVWSFSLKIGNGYNDGIVPLIHKMFTK